jgi:flavodoxin
MQILIAYYTRTGNTEIVAKKIANILDADTEKIVDKKNRSGIFGWLRAGYHAKRQILTEIEPSENESDNYDLILLGTPIWAGNPTPAIRTYIKRHKNNFKKIGLLVTSKGGKNQPVFDELIKASGKTPIAKIGFIEKEIKNNSIDSQVKDFCDEIKSKLKTDS